MNQNRLPILIIPTALVGGVTMFFVVTIFLSVNFDEFQFRLNTSESSPLVLPFCGIFAVCLIGSIVIPMLLKNNVEEDSVKSLTTRIIIRYALLEGAALFGLVIIFIHHTENKATEFNFVWVGLSAYVCLVANYIQEFPRLLTLIQSDT